MTRTRPPPGGGAVAARDSGTAIEINVGSFLEAGVGNEPFAHGYRRLVRLLAEEGACFALGSDAHRIGELGDIALGFHFVAEMGIDAGRIWRPPGTPANMERAEGS